ncbi:MAG: type IV pili methyl-accepting chemotaxis transducer N-terminal domain-containing protein [candidate division KSB1 bacterium]|nr:type IV pili methyl-accepting chemotaxis transducer N-terminal domain-containing protein [candidate division KSB1 bacterium]MDZ7274263.1 type IV pili methyl-accepting chemotaxis transducer N-terminal domain-containing protein [candidate division KSB1 bacterium]MDZ7287215.1 type IV pili methyl-accepting chemotaxis transducer N-terminal domain-containing protein [candidate division KSB1 bacterium]MDZ7296860.1 type IV pili methyl-accepting chemotaxis transducer N-terminal domain-containing prote
MEKAFLRGMTRRYLFALGVLAIVALLSDHFLQKRIAAERGRAALINLSGRQRLLSQHLTLHALRLIHSRTPAERRHWRREMQHIMEEMADGMHDLLHGDTGRSPSGRPSAAIHALCFYPPHNLHQRLQVYLSAGRWLAQADDRTLTPRHPQWQYLAAASPALLQSLDELVNQQQREGEAAIAELHLLERSVVLITMVVLALMALFIFRPMVQRLREFFAERARAAAEREKLIAELQTALANVKTLRGLIPICASCKKIRDDHGYWNKLEDYIQQHSDADFTHGLCPECQNNFELSEG